MDREALGDDVWELPWVRAKQSRTENQGRMYKLLLDVETPFAISTVWSRPQAVSMKFCFVACLVDSEGVVTIYMQLCLWTSLGNPK